MNSMSIAGNDLADVAKAVMMMRSEMAHREARMGASFDKQMQALRQEVSQVRREVSGIASDTSAQIAQETRDAVIPVADEYKRSVSATSAHLKSAGKTVWLWFGAAGAILLLALLAGWLVVSWYWREVNTAREELSRYENAVTVAQAFYASDAMLCGERICVNIDPNAPRLGEQRQYHQAKAKPRPSPGQK